ncbi:MAG: HD domain-containing protein [Akkermansia sp.]|nr:HD domain-containing protein [Akkermansia sp.]
MSNTVAIMNDGKEAAPVPVLMQAVIFMGASSVSMMVAEEQGEELRVLDVLSQPLALAEDIFRNGSISRETMDRCVQIVQGFNSLLQEYSQGGEMLVRLLATNVLLNVNNMDSITNRLQTACGLSMEVLDDGEMARLLYINTQDMLEQHTELEKKRVLVLHVGPGNTRLLLFDRGRITYYAGYRMGAHRTAMAIRDTHFNSAGHECSLIREQIRGVVEQILHDSEGAIPTEPDALIIFGPDFRHIQSPMLDEYSIDLETLEQLVDDIANTPHAQRLAKYNVDYASVNALLPAAVTYQTLAGAYEPHDIMLPQEEYAHAFLRILLPSRKDAQGLDREVIHFAQLLANRYKIDRGHSQQVRKLCAALFDQLQELHGLTRHDRLLLNVAAVLHEIGTFISPKNHHRHGQYIILNSEIFGLSRLDVEIIGLLARYHRHGAPTNKDSSYAELDLPNRLRVQKLAALLRVADAMEGAHSHRISNFTACYNGRRLELLVPGVHDLTIENLVLSKKADLFTDIFGYDVRLVSAEQ